MVDEAGVFPGHLPSTFPCLAPVESTYGFTGGEYKDDHIAVSLHYRGYLVEKIGCFTNKVKIEVALWRWFGKNKARVLLGPVFI